MATTPKPVIVQPPAYPQDPNDPGNLKAKKYLADESALTFNNMGSTPQEMSANQDQIMQNRVMGQAAAAPGTVAVGAQTGKTASGDPVNFQAFMPDPNASHADWGKTGNYYKGNDLVFDIQAWDPTQGKFVTQTRATAPSSTSYNWNQDKGFYDTKTTPSVNPAYPPGLNPSNSSTPSGASSGTSDAPGTGGVSSTGSTLYKAPDTSSLDDQIKTLGYGRSASDIESELNNTISTISRKADEEMQQAERDAANRQQEDFGQLAGIGTGINPLSSGARSVESRNNLLLDRFKNNIIARRDDAIASARVAAYGQKDASRASQVAALQKQKEDLVAAAKTDYDVRRQAWADTNTALQTAASIARENRTATNQERDDAAKAITDALTTFGSGAFEGVSDEELARIEKTAGWAAGTLKSRTKTLKEKEIEAKKKGVDLKFYHGDKYNNPGYFDPSTGAFTPLTGSGIVRPPTGGGSSKAGSYFTIPDKAGVIQYKFGNPKDPEKAQTLDKKAYLEGVSKSEGVLNPKDDETQFLNQDFFKNTLGHDALVKAAGDAGYTSWSKNDDEAVKDYLTNLDSSIKAYRSAGYSDKEILKMMQ